MTETMLKKKKKKMLKKGKLYWFRGAGWLRKAFGSMMDGDMLDCEENPICYIRGGVVVMYLEQNLKHPYRYKVVYNDIVGWVHGYPDQFEEVEDQDAESNERARKRQVV